MLIRLLFTALLAVTLASAQGRKGGGGGGGMGGGGGAPMGMGRPSRVDQFIDRLKLTKEQREGVQTILLAALEQTAPLRDQVNKGRVAITGAIIEGKPADEQKKMMDDLTSLQTQLTELETKT